MSNTFIPLSIPNISEIEIRLVNEALTDGWVSSVGPHVDKFEAEFAKYVGVKHAISCINGTAALHISLLMCGVTQNDEVIAPNLTFVAPLNAIKYVGATPVLMDSEWSTLGMDIDKLATFLNEETYYKDGFTFNITTHKRIKAIVPMHTLGYCVDMDALIPLCEKHNIDIIEDATESLGSEYKGVKTGTFGKMGCFSFNGNKIMTTGGGGMIVTNDATIASKAKHLTTTAKTDPVEYDHDMVGYNYRLANLLAAFGLGQLERMPAFVETKRKNLALYKTLLEETSGMYIHTEAAHTKSNYWMYSLVFDKGYKHSVREVVDLLSKEKIQTRPIWKLMNQLPMYSNIQSYHCDTSLDIYQRLISIPCSTHITEEDIRRVVDCIKNL